MEEKEYIVELLDGDYAHLRDLKNPKEEFKLVARALLPENIKEGTKLRYEMFEYEVME